MVFVKLTNCTTKYVSDMQCTFANAFGLLRVSPVSHTFYNTREPVPFLHLDEEVNEMMCDLRGIYARHR
jgi:hypothetical protein